jgi:hypothetical protein
MQQLPHALHDQLDTSRQGTRELLFMMVYCLYVRVPKYLTHGLSLLFLLGYLHIVEEPVDVIVLPNEVLCEAAEPVKDA